jgi:hypothetical protein
LLPARVSLFGFKELPTYLEATIIIIAASKRAGNPDPSVAFSVAKKFFVSSNSSFSALSFCSS